MYVMHTSRHYFSSLGFRDIFPDLGQTRMFEQARDTIYPRVSQTTSRIWRKVTTFNVEYDLIWIPEKDKSSGIIEQIDITGDVWGSAYEQRFGYATDLIIDKKYTTLRRFLP